MRRLKGSINGNEHDHHHQNHIDAQAPQQNTHSDRKFPRPETRLPLGRNHLVCLKERQNNARIFQVRLCGIRSDRAKIAAETITFYSV